MIDISAVQYNLIYNAFSFAVAVMGAATLFLILGRSQVAPAYRVAISVSALVTAVALYHYFRITASWNRSQWSCDSNWQRL